MNINLILFFMNMFSGMGFSILSPLFPAFGIKNGLTESLIGWVIGVFALSSTCISPFTPRLIKRFTRIKLLQISTFCEASSTLLYGIISYINSFYALLIFMFIIRIIHGCCCGIIGTLVFSLTISLSKPSEVQKALGNLEIAWCIGITSGPIFASIFYKIGGYHLPFLMLGSFLYISFYLSTKVAQVKTESEEKNDGDPPFLKYFAYCDVILILGVFFSGYIAQSFFFPSLTNHLKKEFGLSVSISSLFFIIIAISNFIILHFLDSVTKKFGHYGTSCIGLIIVSFGVLMIYPYPPIPKSIICIIFGFVLIGGGGVPVFIPGLVALSKHIKKIDPNVDDLSVNDITSAINFLTINIGDFSGPIIGGFLSTNLGFKYSCLIISSFIILYCLIFFIYFYKYIFNDIKKIGSNSNLDILKGEGKSEENELFNHPGKYKDINLDDISGMVKKEEKSGFEYMSLNDNNS